MSIVRIRRPPTVVTRRRGALCPRNKLHPVNAIPVVKNSRRVGMRRVYLKSAHARTLPLSYQRSSAFICGLFAERRVGHRRDDSVQPLKHRRTAEDFHQRRTSDGPSPGRPEEAKACIAAPGSCPTGTTFCSGRALAASRGPDSRRFSGYE
jgi:hypothetical protein